jgi:hypothetical protein
VTSLTVATRFCGPPGTANGGWLSGRLAAEVDAPVVAVRLRRPTPLERPLQVRRDGAAVDLLDGGELLARAEPAELDLEVPAPPSVADAVAAAAARPPRTEHPFPSCFGCGPLRRPGDAVAAVLGPLPGRPDVWAGIWRPTAELPSSDGVAASETVWAALDCPSFQPVQPDDGVPHVLGTLVARQERPVRLDTDHVLLAWALGRDGRRATSASAIIGPDGEVCARARAIWFTVPRGLIIVEWSVDPPKPAG